MSYSSASSLAHQVSPIGVPSRCWCGEDIITYTSKTKDNPYRRFYRCSIALMFGYLILFDVYLRKNENHLFKWVDEALLDEINMVDEKWKRVSEDVDDLRKQMMANMELQNEIFKKIDEEMVKKISENIESELVIIKDNVEELGHVMVRSAFKTAGVAAVIVCSLVWIWGRM
ncbi:PREDICTED: uncharacterized protein At4g04775-like [Camelina sativa]|uniref:Uncharacterized protein At4g04775-like n=1 Tax=Camelina sativa TaxID=90675 RepID=A0ABM0WPF9_CAMSA|nr:PREDICTED: uncharacterized protein At4g04775-like [Camelina sativa]